MAATATFGVTYPATPSPTVASHSSNSASASASSSAAARMSAATFSTSSKRSRSYRLCVKPSPVRAIPDSVSAHRKRSTADTACWSVTDHTLVVVDLVFLAVDLGAGRPRVHRLAFGEHCRAHAVGFVGGELPVAAVPQVEGVDHLVAECRDLRVADVEMETADRPGHPIEQPDRVGGAHFDHRCILGRVVVHPDAGFCRARRGGSRLVPARAHGD